MSKCNKCGKCGNNFIESATYTDGVFLCIDCVLLIKIEEEELRLGRKLTWKENSKITSIHHGIPGIATIPNDDKQKEYDKQYE